MDAFEQKRRSILVSLGGLGMSQALSQTAIEAQSASPQSHVLGPNEGEHLVHFRDQADIFIKFGSASGSGSLAMGTQQVKSGTGIPTHRHFQMDEAFYVLEGSGIFTLNDQPRSFEKGTTIFIPKNSWHGFTNPDHELLLLWIVAPPGLEGFFRDTCNPPGVPPRQFTRAQINEIARKYGTEFR
jgi:quercetin dioxygenase-like cupin family protein